MSARTVSFALAAAGAVLCIAWVSERDQGTPAPLTAPRHAGPTAAGDREAHRRAVLDLMSGRLDPRTLPEDGVPRAFARQDEPRAPEAPRVGSTVKATDAAVRATIQDLRITGESPGADERLAAMAEDVRACAASLPATAKDVPFTVAFRHTVFPERDPSPPIARVALVPFDALSANAHLEACVREAILGIRFLARSGKTVVMGKVLISR